MPVPNAEPENPDLEWGPFAAQLPVEVAKPLKFHLRTCFDRSIEGQMRGCAHIWLREARNSP